MAEIVSVEDLKEHLNVTGSADDEVIERKLAAATAHVGSSVSIDFDTLEGPAPAPLAEAIRMLAAHLYENREAVHVGSSIAAVPLGFDELIRPYRQEWF